ncbi:putative gamma-glutamylcyclotransferase At3g02910 [Silene latifolia]|uniref:putative gamma-glutamylcyclotransferase At3g02910 n=1 Tax=Silene latifolia TaxID=37657 RepID=UPI003D780858
MSTNNDNNKALIFVYGTLKQGFPNHHLLETLTASNDAQFLGPHTTVHPYPLVRGPLGIPFLINHLGSGRRVSGELYLVSGRALARLDELEGVDRGHYERLPATVVPTPADGGDGAARVEAEAYFADRSFGMEMWEKSGREGIEEYRLSDADKYVGIEARDVGFKLKDYILLYLQQ